MSTIDQIALDTVQAIADIDPDKLKGGKVQAMAQAQCLVIDAMKQAGVPDMRPIAQKKIKQMGATVHGVLAKNEAGAWVAVSEAGRVMWLDNFEGRDSSVQPEQPGAAVVPDMTSAIVNDCCWTFVEAMPHNLPGPIFNDLKPALYEALKQYHGSILTAAPTAPAVQGGGVPEPYAWAYPLRYGAGLSFTRPTPPEGWEDFADEWYCEPLYKGQAPAHPHNGEQGGECGIKFLIWSNEHNCYWRPNSAGYTRSIAEAGRYGQSHAESICRNAGPRAGSDLDETIPPEMMMVAPEYIAGLTRPQPPKSKEGE